MLCVPDDEKDAIREMQKIHEQNMIKRERELVRAGIQEALKIDQRSRMEGHINTIIQKAKGDHEDQSEAERETIQPATKRRKRRNKKKGRK